MKNFTPILAGLFSALLVGCGISGDYTIPPPPPYQAPSNTVQQPAPPVPLESLNTPAYEWLMGDWHIEGEPSSLGDLGADVRNFHISQTEIWAETFGHLAAENFMFNTAGNDYGGNCLYRVHSTDFGILPATATTTASLELRNPTFELMSDPGNRSDCDRQIDRINHVFSVVDKGGSENYALPVKNGNNAFLLGNDGRKYDKKAD